MTRTLDYLVAASDELRTAVRDLECAHRDLLLHSAKHGGADRLALAVHAERLDAIAERLSLDGVLGSLARARGAAMVGAELDRLDAARPEPCVAGETFDVPARERQIAEVDRG